MTLRPIVRSLVVPILGLSLSGIAAHPAVAEGEAAATHKVVNVNEASAQEIARLPRVGAKLADRIVAHRKEHGAFRRAEDLMQVKGVGEKFFTTLKPYVAVSGPTTLVEKVSSAGTRTKAGAKASTKTAKPAKPAKSASNGTKASKITKVKA
jgi:competence protein ComEA